MLRAGGEERRAPGNQLGATEKKPENIEPVEALAARVTEFTAHFAPASPLPPYALVPGVLGSSKEMGLGNRGSPAGGNTQERNSTLTAALPQLLTPPLPNPWTWLLLRPA